MTNWAVAIGAIGLVAQGLAAWWWFKASRTMPDDFHLVGCPQHERGLQQARSHGAERRRLRLPGVAHDRAGLMLGSSGQRNELSDEEEKRRKADSE